MFLSLWQRQADRFAYPEVEATNKKALSAGLAKQSRERHL